MSTEADQTWDSSQQAVNQIVRFALETSYRDPILEAVADAGAMEVAEESIDEADEAGDAAAEATDRGAEQAFDETGSSGGGGAFRVLLVFAVVCVIAYAVLKRNAGRSGE